MKDSPPCSRHSSRSSNAQRLFYCSDSAAGRQASFDISRSPSTDEADRWEETSVRIYSAPTVNFICTSRLSSSSSKSPLPKCRSR